MDGLFHEVLLQCREAGLVKLGRVALDGTRIKASASRHKSKSYARSREEEDELRRLSKEILREAEKTDEEEDQLYGKDQNPLLHPAPPDWKERLKKAREARKALEERARKKGQKESETTAQYNFTDPDSRIVQDSGNKRAFVQGYNAQVAVDAESQVIVMAAVTQENGDGRHLLPMAEELERELGELPAKLLADAGYFSEAQIRAVEARGTSIYCPPDSASDRRESLSERVAADRRELHASIPTEGPKSSGTCRVSLAEGQRGAGLRADQTGETTPTVPSPRQSEGRS